MKPKKLLSKKSMLAALLTIVIAMALNVTITVRGAKPNLAKTTQAAATERSDEKKAKEAFDKLPLYFIESRQGEDGQAGYYVQGKDKSGTATQVKHEFIVRPGADPRDIKLAWRGASSVKLKRDGQIEISTPVASFTDDKPYSYQETDGQRMEVKTAYRLEPVEEEGVQVYGFEVGEYDRDQTLVIDPAMIIYCGYIGGERDDMAMDVAVDSNGCAYVTGVTSSGSSTDPALGRFPTTVGPDITYNGGSRDAFVAKVRADGSGLVYCGYIGGDAGEYGYGIAVDNLGRAYVAGVTFSTQETFPDKNGPDLSHNSGGNDAFVARVNAAGTALDYCGYIGGSGSDTGLDIAVDGNYNAYVIGSTSSAEDFPSVIGPDPTYNGGSSDVFVTKVNSSGTAILYSGFIGGAGTDYGYGLAVDSAGSAYVTGITHSSQQSFPVKNGPDLTFNGSIDSFVAKVNAAGQQLDYCGYIGGGGSGEGIAVNSQGEAHVCGIAGPNLQVVAGPSLTPAGSSDALVARLNSGGTGSIYCGYLGGSGHDSASAIEVDSIGRAYVTGVTSSADFPVGGGPDSSYNGGEDVFITCVKPNGASLFYSSYLGGSGYEYPNGIAVAPASRAQVFLYGAPTFIVGRTNSRPVVSKPSIPFPVNTGPSLTYGGTGGGLGWGDAFVAKIGQDVFACPNGCPSEP